MSTWKKYLESLPAESKLFSGTHRSAPRPTETHVQRVTRQVQDLTAKGHEATARSVLHRCYPHGQHEGQLQAWLDEAVTAGALATETRQGFAQRGGSFADYTVYSPTGP